MPGNIFRDQAEAIFRAALSAADPYRAVRLHTPAIRSLYQEQGFTRLLVAAFGKAASPMAKAALDDLGDLVSGGLLLTKYGHTDHSEAGTRIRSYEAGHPLPDENGLRAAREMMGLLKDAESSTLVLCLISGGGSALLVLPSAGITLEEKKKATELLLKSGADISALNTVRKHISDVKGGRLAEASYPAGVLSLILSDVVGDRLDVIASGPTSPDPTFYRDALSTVERYGLGDRMPKSIMDRLRGGAEGGAPETPKESSPVFRKVENIIVGSNKKSLDAARAAAKNFGFETRIVSAEVQGEARLIGRQLAKQALELRDRKDAGARMCLISGGETTVTVKGKGKGGRNMELALSFALEVEGRQGITFLSAGTDGTDGPTDAAGAFVDGETVSRARRLGISPEEYLENNDSYSFFERAGGLFITGPTGTNVMDIQLTLLHP
ncbi:MAG: glycerate kinase [Nitrospirae bacterium]|nr:glycerate kinase [Nitrospirota bacterium]